MRGFPVPRRKVVSTQIVYLVWKVTLPVYEDWKQDNTEVCKKYDTFSLAVTVQSKSRAVYGGQDQKQQDRFVKIIYLVLI